VTDGEDCARELQEAALLSSHLSIRGGRVANALACNAGFHGIVVIVLLFSV